MKDPHQNIFFYYRGPSNKPRDPAYDPQIEDNTTKSFINVLEFFHKVQFNSLVELLLKTLDIPRNSVLSFALQKGGDLSRPDALIRLANYNIYVEVKVRAPLKLDQLRSHLRHMNSRDWLLVISNNKSDKNYLKFQFSDKRLLFLTWAQIHKLCLEVLNQISGDKRHVTVYQFLKYFVEYLEVVVMIEFNGFRSEDFDFWLDKNPYYVPILKKKVGALAQIIKSKLPESLRKVYSVIRTGNVSTKIEDKRFAWVAIKKPENRRDKFSQCNFTIEVSKSSLDINTVIRNGHVTDLAKPIGVFYDKLLTQFEAFLKIIDKIKKIKRACKKLGIGKNITNHSFRHYVVTSILDRTANVEVVKAITGHKDTKTIFEHYAHAKSEMVEKTLEISHIDTGLFSKKIPKKYARKCAKLSSLRNITDEKSKIWCRRGDLNSHGNTPTAP